MRLLGTVFFATSAAFCSAVAQGVARDSVIALVGVTVIDPGARGTGVQRSGQTIIVANGVVRATGPSRSVTVPRGARRIDASGKFAIPGLWDSHVHFMNATASALPMYLALGVTSVREMGGYIDSTRAWQARMRAGTLVGPRILTPGPILESPRYLDNVRQRSIRDPRIGLRVLPYRIGVADSADARKAIDSLVALKVDFVKIRTTSTPESYFAILREARRAGLLVTGHQPGVPLMSALDSGQSDIEHALFPSPSRLAAGARDSVYRRFIERGAWYAPTLVVSRAVMLSGDSADKAIFGADVPRTDERHAYAPAWLLEWWRMQVDERKLDTSATRATEMESGYRGSVDDVRRMHELGVQLLAGTDAGSVLVYPGFSLHEELRLLVEDAGLAPRDALWSATIGPARFARLESTLGTIASGKTADIVLLDANPLANIRNTRRIFAVMQQGRYFPRRELDQMLERVRTAVRK